MQRSQSVKCTTNGKNTNSRLSLFSRNLRSTTPSEQQSRQTLTEFDDVYTSAVSPGPFSLIGLVWLCSNWQNTANSTVLLKALMTMMVSVVTVVTEFQPATPEPRTTTSLGANDLVVTGHAHSVPHSSRRDTGRNDGFTAWQIRIRSLDRRLRLLAALWPIQVKLHWC